MTYLEAVVTFALSLLLGRVFWLAFFEGSPDAKTLSRLDAEDARGFVEYSERPKIPGEHGRAETDISLFKRRRN